MARPKTKEVRSFAMKIETLALLREVVEEAGITGGASVIAEDAISAWIRRYKADPKAWLLQRGISAVGTPESDDL